MARGDFVARRADIRALFAEQKVARAQAAAYDYARESMVERTAWSGIDRFDVILRLDEIGVLIAANDHDRRIGYPLLRMNLGLEGPPIDTGLGLVGADRLYVAIGHMVLLIADDHRPLPTGRGVRLDGRYEVSARLLRAARRAMAERNGAALAKLLRSPDVRRLSEGEPSLFAEALRARAVLQQIPLPAVRRRTS
jgi:hypothetical protein